MLNSFHKLLKVHRLADVTIGTQIITLRNIQFFIGSRQNDHWQAAGTSARRAATDCPTGYACSKPDCFNHFAFCSARTFSLAGW